MAATVCGCRSRQTPPVPPARLRTRVVSSRLGGGHRAHPSIHLWRVLAKVARRSPTSSITGPGSPIVAPLWAGRRLSPRAVMLMGLRRFDGTRAR
jgi:hypothetical protein